MKTQQYLTNIVDNYINGNIATAKKQAKRFSMPRIRDCLINEYGYSFKKATLTAEHMKGHDCWQAACDSE